MPNNFTDNLSSNINAQKAQNLLDIIQTNRSNPLYSTTLQSVQSLFSQMFSAFQKFFTTLGKPTVELKLQKLESPPVSADYNTTNKQIYNDIQLAYQEVNSLGNTLVQNYNYSESERQMLSNMIAKLNSDAQDYFMFTAGATSQSIFAGDNFVDNTKIDLGASDPGYSQAQISTTQGVATLAVTGNTNLQPKVLTVTGLTETEPAWNPSAQTGCYEGYYWALQNQMRPEGVGLNLQYSSDGTNLVELGSPESLLVANRMRMFDGNADTFWEIEYVTSLITGYQNLQTGAQISVSQFNDLLNNDAGSSAATTIGGVVVASNTGSLSSNFQPIVNSATIPSLAVNFTIQMEEPVNMNWISLNPNNFGETNYLQVVNIQLSPDGTTFQTLPGFGNGSADTTLTNLTNQELNPDQATETLSPDLYGYAGQGIWVFDPQSVSAIKFSINQPQAYNNPYAILMVTVSQTFTTTTTSSSFFGLFKSTSTSTKTVTENVAIPYLVGQVTGFDVMSLQSGSSTNNVNTGLIAGISQLVSGNVVGLEGIAAGAIVGGAIAGVAGAIGSVLATGTAALVGDAFLGAALGPVGILIGIVGALFGSSTKSSTTAGPQTITKQWVATQYDKDRFAIGVREIGLYAYEFDTQSQLTSQPFVSPLPISSVSLKVTENIPSAFLTSAFVGQQYNWITYFVSFDNGTSWHQIAPESHADTISSDGANLIPQIINVNSNVPASNQNNPLAYVTTTGPAYTVQFRAVFTRPTSIENANSYTTTLYSYQLQIYQLVGLS